MKINFNKAYLYDKNGYITHIFTRTGDYFVGRLETVISWDIVKNPNETLFVGEVYIKFDGCSHWNFLGEDYMPNSETEIDGYYHICGFHYYLEFIKGMLFTFKLATETITSFSTNEFNKFKQYEYLLDGCSIKIAQN